MGNRTGLITQTKESIVSHGYQGVQGEVAELELRTAVKKRTESDDRCSRPS